MIKIERTGTLFCNAQFYGGLHRVLFSLAIGPGGALLSVRDRNGYDMRLIEIWYGDKEAEINAWYDSWKESVALAEVVKPGLKSQSRGRL